jgi:hypothetical protein
MMALKITICQLDMCKYAIQFDREHMYTEHSVVGRYQNCNDRCIASHCSASVRPPLFVCRAS